MQCHSWEVGNVWAFLWCAFQRIEIWRRLWFFSSGIHWVWLMPLRALLFCLWLLDAIVYLFYWAHQCVCKRQLLWFNSWSVSILILPPEKLSVNVYIEFVWLWDYALCFVSINIGNDLMIWWWEVTLCSVIYVGMSFCCCQSYKTDAVFCTLTKSVSFMSQCLPEAALLNGWNIAQDVVLVLWLVQLDLKTRNPHSLSADCL